MKRLLLAATFALAALPAWAGRLVEVNVHDLERDERLPEYRHGARWYVPGTPGHRYAVTLTNRTGRRVLAVLSVDGVNAVSGQTADPAQAGYVLGPWERAEIRGWRKSLDEVAEFVFTALPDSYAARTGRPGNVGVIGVAVFEEALPAWEPSAPPIARQEAPAGRDSAGENEAPAAAAAAPSARDDARAAGASELAKRRQDLGTGHGARRHDPVRTTAFRRASRAPAEIVSLFYDDAHALAARGILPRPALPAEPDPFPLGFVPDPY